VAEFAKGLNRGMAAFEQDEALHGWSVRQRLFSGRGGPAVFAAIERQQGELETTCQRSGVRRPAVLDEAIARKLKEVGYGG
jgi:hypothetical protein